MKFIFEPDEIKSRNTVLEMLKKYTDEDLDVKYIPANPELGFNFGYVMFVPKNIRYNILLVCGNNNSQEEAQQRQIDFKRKITNEADSVYCGSAVLQILNALKIFKGSMPIMVPCIPAYRDGIEEEFFPQQYGANSLRVTDETSPFYHFDQQIIKMINDAKKRVSDLINLELDEKIAMYGFSTSAKFAYRFTCLHPELVKLVASGGNGSMNILPFSSLGDLELDYPLGVNDVEQIVGHPFNADEYRQIPQFYFDGELDPNELIFQDRYPYIFVSKGITEKYKLLFGESKMPDFSETSRWYQIKQLFEEAGYNNVVFKLYKGVGHTPVPAYDDIRSFFEKHLASNIIKTQTR